jgi:hypothetical protein
MLEIAAGALDPHRYDDAMAEPILKRQDMDGRQPWEKKP